MNERKLIERLAKKVHGYHNCNAELCPTHELLQEVEAYLSAPPADPESYKVAALKNRLGIHLFALRSIASASTDERSIETAADALNATVEPPAEGLELPIVITEHEWICIYSSMVQMAETGAVILKETRESVLSKIGKLGQTAYRLGVRGNNG